MAIASPPRPLKRHFHRRLSSLDAVLEETLAMADNGHSRSASEPELGASGLSMKPLPGSSTYAGAALLGDRPPMAAYPPSTPTPGLSRTGSFNSSYQDENFSDPDDGSFFPPVERLTMFDFIENLALQQRVEKIQSFASAQTEKLRKRAKNRGTSTRDRVVEEWRRRIPTEGEQLDKYKQKMRRSVVTLREKASFITAVMNIFISGYLVGAHPEIFPYWYAAQLLYFMPIRFYTYHKKGYHYFLADLCYFVNFLVLLSVWVFPKSKRLFISTYCLAMGNNAIAIAMWRNSLVFHSMDKVVR
jgi:hypothetical protein